MTKKYELEYDWATLACVTIDEVKAEESIREMVEFWSGWEDALEDNQGDYTRTWLKNLAKFILRNGRIPHDEEGWVWLQGTHGITVKLMDVWRPDNDEIEIKEL